MSEEIQNRISELRKRLKSVNKSIKSKGFRIDILDGQLRSVRKLINSEIARRNAFIRWYREFDKKGLVERAEEEAKKVIESGKEIESLKDTRTELYYRRDGYVIEKEELEEELERLKRKIIPPVIIPPVEVPELIDINEEDGYLIYYSRVKNLYFKVHPDEYKRTGGMIVE